MSPIHPLLLSQLPASEVSLERVCEDIHAYRPASTVWELERGKGASEVVVRSLRHADDGAEATDAPVVDRAEEGGGEAQGSFSSLSPIVEEEAKEEALLNEHEREAAEEGHLEPKPAAPSVGKPHISVAMRALLRKNGQKTINVRSLAAQAAPKPEAPVSVERICEE